jgi:hypothetical protein
MGLVKSKADIDPSPSSFQNSGLTCEMLPDGEPMPAKLREELEEGMQKWQQARQSRDHQIHTTTLRTMTDCRHRSYLVARDSKKKACGFVRLRHLPLFIDLKISQHFVSLPFLLARHSPP